MSDRAALLRDLLAWLQEQDYAFTTITPASHARVIAQPGRSQAHDLRGIFGWSLPFAPDLLPEALRERLTLADLVHWDGPLLRSRLRVSSLDGVLFLHSAYPTTDADAVFFGPDSYRFVRLAEEVLNGGPAPSGIVDIGAGSGVGGIMAARRFTGVRTTLLDINPLALELACVNAQAAGVAADCVEGGSLDAVHDPFDLVLANPPFIMDDEERAYRHGGGMDGAQVSFDWTIDAARRMPPGGRMLLYTGVAIRGGRDPLRTALEDALPGHDCTLRYQELDPDIFGEELENEAYHGIDRIAAVGAVVTKA